MSSLIPSDIRRVWDLLPHFPDTYIRWFARAGQERIGGGVNTLEELLWAAYSAQDMNFYIAPNPASTRAGTRHRAADVSHWSWFLIDVDPVEANAQPELAVEEVLRILSDWWGIDFRERRPLLIHSGRGAQVWIRLDDFMVNHPCIALSDGNIYMGLIGSVVSARTARITNGYWLRQLADRIGTLRGCRIDTTCADLPRVMRCPGTKNMKTGRSAILIVPSAESFYGLSSTLVGGVPSELFEPVPVPVLPPGTPWQTVYVHLTLRAQSYLTQGKDEPGRHDTMFHVALCLAERGLDRDSTRVALQHGNERWDALHPGAPSMTLKPEEIEHALDTAYRRLQRDRETGTLEVGTPTQEVTDAEGV